MTSKPKQPAKTPFDKFTEAAKHVFTLPKSDVKKIQAKVPRSTQTRK